MLKSGSQQHNQLPKYAEHEDAPNNRDLCHVSNRAGMMKSQISHFKIGDEKTLSFTSPLHKLTVSMSLLAHARAPWAPPIQPALEILHPQLPTDKPASSSSLSAGLEVHNKPSVDAERRTSSEPKREKRTVVMSSEWVSLCFRSGATGLRGSQ